MSEYGKDKVIAVFSDSRFVFPIVKLMEHTNISSGGKYVLIDYGGESEPEPMSIDTATVLLDRLGKAISK